MKLPIMAILNWIKANKILAFVLIAAVTYSIVKIFEAKSKAVQQDCTVWQEQNKQCNEQNAKLIGAFIDIKKELSVVKPTAYYWNEKGYFEFASLKDTVPTQRQKEKAAVQKVMTKIDSILWKWKQDSINRTKQKSKT